MPLAAETVPVQASLEAQKFRAQVGHISRQSGIFFGGTIFSAGMGYVFKVYLARVLGAENLGLYALGMTLVGFVGIFNGLGLPQSAVRFVASYVAAGKFGHLHSLLWRGAALLGAANIIFGVVLLTLGRPIALRFYHSPALLRFLPWFAAIMLLGVLNAFLGKILAGYRDLGRRTAIVSFVGTPLTMLTAIVLIGIGLGLRGYLAAQVISATVVVAFLLAAVRTLTPREARFSPFRTIPFEKDVWSFSAAMLGIGFLDFLIVQADKIALGYFRSAREVGIYSVAAALTAYVPLVLQSVNQIFAPTIADLHTRGDHMLLARLFQSLTKWIMALTVPIAAVIIIFARPLMRIFGPGFEVGWPILVIGTLGQLVNCGVGSVGFLLLMSGNEKRLIKVQAAMATLMLLLSVALVPVWGIVGAAIAAAITNVGTNLWNLLQVRACLHVSPYNRSYLHLVPPAAASIALTMLLKSKSAVFHHDWLAIGVTGVLAYTTFAIVALGFGLTSDDRLIANAVWRRVRAAFSQNGAAV